MALVIPSKRVLALRTADPARVKGIFPNAQVVDGVKFGVTGSIVGVPHKNQSLTVLRNMGFDPVGYEPIRSYYQYPHIAGRLPPMAHQLTTSEFLTVHPKLFCLNEQRTGKTASVIWSADFMKREADVKGVLIVTTMSCLRTVWSDGVFSITPSRSVAVLYGSAAKRRELLARDYDYYVINHDGIKVIAAELLEAITSGRIDLVVVDECAEFSDSTTDKYEVLKTLTDAAKRVWCLTGTPMSKGPDAVWAQVRLIDPSRVPKFITEWKYRTMIRLSKYKWIPKADAIDQVYAAMQPAIRFKKRDVLKNLPPLTVSDREVELSTEQKSMMKELRRQGALMLDGKRLTAANAAVMVGKLLQIAAGSVKLDDGQVKQIDCRPRLRELDSLIDGTEAKFIVLGNYHASIDMLQAHLAPRHKTVWIDGRVTGHARDKAIQKFMHDPECRGLVAHPRTIGHGLEFSVADTLVWWSPCHNKEWVAQADERMASIGQTNPMGIYRIGANFTEWSIYRNVYGALSLQASAMELFKKFVDALDT